MQPSKPSSEAQRLSPPFAVAFAFLAALAVAALSLALAVPVFKAIVGDCAPGQQDGQCGLGTFVAFLCAIGTSVIVCIVAAVKFSRRFLAWSKKP